MRAPCHNLTGSGWSRGLLAIGLSSVSLLALAGVTARPALSLVAAGSSIADEQDRVAAVVALQRKLEAFDAAGGPEMVELALARLAALLPREVEPIEVFSLLRFCARGAGFELQSLDVGGVVDLGLPGERDAVELIELNVAGLGDLASLVRLIELVAAQGYPLAVLDVAVQRDPNRPQLFRHRASLGAPYFARGAALMATPPLAEGAP